MARHPVPSEVPVKLYRTVDLVTVAAPMPGLEPEDVFAEVTRDGHLLLAGEVTPDVPGAGALEDRESKQVLLEEWTPGPYHRDVVLPAAVDGRRATLTYGNGVVVVALPLADEPQPARLRPAQRAVPTDAADRR